MRRGATASVTENFARFASLAFERTALVDCSSSESDALEWDGMERSDSWKLAECDALRCVALCCVVVLMCSLMKASGTNAQRSAESGCCETCDSGARAFAELFGRGGRRVDLTVELALALALFLRRRRGDCAHSVRRSVLTSPLLVAVPCRAVLLVRPGGPRRGARRRQRAQRRAEQRRAARIRRPPRRRLSASAGGCAA